MKRKKANQSRRRYDVAMIRDFLEHLLWDLRVFHFEMQHGNTINPEMLEQLGKYVKRYGCGLTRSSLIDGAEANRLGSRRAEEALARFRQGRARYAQEMIGRLEALAPVFSEALHCASKEGLQNQMIRLADYLDAAAEGEEGRQ